MMAFNARKKPSNIMVRFSLCGEKKKQEFLYTVSSSVQHHMKEKIRVEDVGFKVPECNARPQ